MMKRMRWYLIGLIIGLVGVLVVCSFFQPTDEGKKEKNLTWSELSSGVKLVVLTWWEQVQILTQVSGKLTKIFKEPGIQVKGGEPILEFSDEVVPYLAQAQYVKNRLDKALVAKDFLLSSLQDVLDQEFLLLESDLAQREAALAELLSWGRDFDDEQVLSLQKQIVELETKLSSHLIKKTEQDAAYRQKIIDLDMQIAQAKLDYELALNQTAQLTLRASVDGKLGEILIKQWETVSANTLAFHLIRPLQYLEFKIWSGELAARSSSKLVDIKTKQKNLTWSIVSLLPADQGDFLVTIELWESVDPTWEVAQISLQSKK